MGPSSVGAPPFGGASFGITASIPSRNCCRPSPCVRLSRTRSTTAAPPRSGPIGRRWTQPKHHAGSVGSGKDRNGSRVHLQLARRRRSPTLSLRHRHSYPAALHRGLPGEHPHAHPRVPHPTNAGNGCAPHPAHIRQIGAGEPLRDVVTLVPRVLLFVTLAEPTPSGSTGMSRLCQGCSHPPRHLPGRAALSCTALLRQDGDEGLPPPIELSAPHGARGSRLSRSSACRAIYAI